MSKFKRKRHLEMLNYARSFLTGLIRIAKKQSPLKKGSAMAQLEIRGVSKPAA